MSDETIFFEEEIITEHPNVRNQIYRVFCDGYEMLDFSQKDYALLAPDLELEVNTAGHLEFTMSPYHPYYDRITPFKSTMEVYEDERLIWFGRPVDIRDDFFKQKKVYCEGPLSFFNDTVQRPIEFEDYLLSDFFNDVIQRHNSQVSSRSRQFYVGNFTMDDKQVYRKLNYESTYDILTRMCLDAEGGYFFFRREGAKNYIDWVKEMPYACNQPIQFALNMLDYNSDFDGSDFATQVLPLGDNDLTVESVNDGSDVLTSEAVATYGKITKVQSFSGITDAFELKTEGQKYLEDTQFNSTSIECSAADLHPINGEYEQFVLGQMIHCVSIPHLVDKDFPLSKMSIRLDSAVKQITLGTIKRKTLTKIFKQETEAGEQEYDPGYDSDYTPDYDPGVVSDLSGDLWEVIPPEKEGDPVTAIRMPTHITVARNPNKMDYENGEAIDFTGLLVNIWCNDKIWTNPPRYLDGRAPMSELSFSSKRATFWPTYFGDVWESTIVVTWKYKGKEYKTSFKINVRKEGLNPAPLQRPIPASPTGNMTFGSQTQNYSFTAGSGLYTQWLVTERTCGHLAASANPGAIISMRDANGRGWSQELKSSFTYNGKTVYYWYNSQGGAWPGIYVHGSPLCNGGAYVTGVSKHSAESAAWIMIYGG